MNKKLGRTEKVKSFLKQVMRVGIEIARSRPVQAIFWVFASVVAAISIAFLISLIRLPFTQAFDLLILIRSSVILLVVFLLTNLLIVFRSAYLEHDPLIDLRYHARILKEIQGKESQFLFKLHRKGIPKEMYASEISTLNKIEQAFPFTLMMTSMGGAFFGLFATIFGYNFFLKTINHEECFAFVGSILFVGFMFYFGIGQGILSPWDEYRSWKNFWTAYWEHILSKVESSDLVVKVAEERGAWHSIVGWRYWGSEYEITNDKINQNIRNRAKQILRENSIGDSLPDSDDQLVHYLDSLALFLDIKNSIEQDEDEILELAEESRVYETALDDFRKIDSLRDSNIKSRLQSIDGVLSLLPVARVSLTAFNEINDIDSLPSESSEKLRDWAESRLDVLWNLSGSPIPESLKWVTAFYSLSSLIATSVISLI